MTYNFVKCFNQSRQTYFIKMSVHKHTLILWGIRAKLKGIELRWLLIDKDECPFGIPIYFSRVPARHISGGSKQRFIYYKQ